MITERLINEKYLFGLIFGDLGVLKVVEMLPEASDCSRCLHSLTLSTASVNVNDLPNAYKSPLLRKNSSSKANN